MRSIFIIILFKILSISAQDPQEVYCDFVNLITSTSSYYSCFITNANITSTSVPLQFYGIHRDGNTNEDVTNIQTNSVAITMEVFHPQFLTQFPNVERFALDNVRPKSFEIQTCGKINSININRNPEIEIPNGAFRSCNNLKSLTFFSNHFMKIYNDSLNGLGSLETLNFLNNEDIKVTKNLMNDLINLKEFYLGSYGTIDNDALSHLEFLEAISFAGLKYELSFIEELLNGHANLISINLFDAGLETVNFEFFYQFKKLRTLNLRSNQLTNIPAGAFDELTTLENLILSENQITTLEYNTLRGLNNLKNFQISQNSLTNLNSLPFSHLTNLTTLDISNNPIESLPSQLFENNKNSEFLNFHNCTIVELQSNVFKSLPKLFQLALSNNELSSLQVDSFVDLSNLVYFNLNNNNIKRLNSNAFGTLESLWTFDISFNQLDEIEPGFFGKFPRLGSFYGEGNECVTDTITNVNGIDFDNENELSTCFYNWELGRTTSVATTTEQEPCECEDYKMDFWTKFTIIALSISTAVATLCAIIMFVINRRQQRMIAKI